MPRKKTRDALHPDTKKAVVDAVEQKAIGVDAIVDLVDERGERIGRTAAGKWRQDIMLLAESSQRAAAALKTLNLDPESDVGRLCGELLKVLTLRVLDKLSDQEEVGLGDIKDLSRALKDQASSANLTIDRIQKAKEKARNEAVEKISKAAGAAGVSPETIEKIRRDVLGFVNG